MRHVSDTTYFSVVFTQYGCSAANLLYVLVGLSAPNGPHDFPGMLV